MPIKIQNQLPALKVLESENVFVMTNDRAMTQDIRPLKILILNGIKKALLLSYWPGFYALLSSGPLPAVRQAAAGKPPEAVWLLRLRTGGMFRPILPRRR